MKMKYLDCLLRYLVNINWYMVWECQKIPGIRGKSYFNELYHTVLRRLNYIVEKQKKIEANKKLYFTWSLHDYDVKNEGRREGRRLGRKEGMKLGEQKGIESNKLENARKFLAMKIGTHKQIAEGVGLPLEKIEELAAKI